MDGRSLLARSSMRLAAYAGALSNLAVQADSLQMSQEDRALLSSIMMTVSELMWKQSTRTAMYSTRRRRYLALSALGFSEQQRSQLTRDMPFEGPFLFSGQFTLRVKEQLAVRHTARELAGQLRLPQVSRPRTFTQPRAQPRTQAAPPRVTTTFRPRSPTGALAAAVAPRGGGTADSEVIARRPKAAVAFDCLPRALGGRGGRPPAGLPPGLGGNHGRRLRIIRQRRLQHRASRSPSRRRRPSPPPACHPA